MKIYAAYFSQETNTFSPFPTGFSDFEVTRSDDIESGRRSYKDLQPLGTWHESATRFGHEFSFALAALASPSGIATREVYETFRDEIIAGLVEHSPVDIVLLALHGAMVADAYEDCEGELISRVRQTVGDEVVIAVELDLHCHLTRQMVSASDILITFKEYPHDDIGVRGQELFDIAVAAARNEVQPTMAVFDCKMSGLYPTSEPALREFIDNRMVKLEQRKEVLSISFVHGFPWGDVAEGGSKLLVVTDNDEVLARELARELGMESFSMRHELGFNSLSMDEAFTESCALLKTDSAINRPIVVADQSDNPGGGAPGDATYALRWLLEHQMTKVAVGIFYDPEVVRLAASAGSGAKLSIRLGGKMGPMSGEPLDIDVEVLSLRHDYQHLWPQKRGEPIKWEAGHVVALRCGGIDIVVSSKRVQCFSPCIFTDLGIDYAGKHLVVVKSTQHFYSAFAPLAERILYMAAPGAVVPDVRRISYKKMSTHDKFPWNQDPHFELPR